MPTALPMTRDKRLGLILVAVVLVINLLAILLGASALQRSRANYRSDVEVESGNLAMALAYRIAGHSRAIDATLVRIQTLLERQLAAGGIDAAALQGLIDDERALLPEIEGLRVADATGEVRWGSGLPPGKPLNMADRGFFAEHRAASAPRLIVAAPLRGPISGRWVVPYTRAYRGPGGKFAGVVAASVPVEHMAPNLNGMDLGKEGTIVVRYADMGLVVRVPPLPGPAGEPGNAKVSEEFRALVASGKPAAVFHTEASPDSVERTYGFRRVEGLPFMVTIGQASGDYLAHWREEIVKVALLLLALALLSGGTAWAGAHFWRERGALLRASAAEATRRRVLVDNSRDGIAVHDQDHRVIECNARFAEMLGYTQDEALRLHTWDFEATMDEAAIRTAFADLGSISTTIETRHRRKDGSEYDVEVSLSATRLDGRFVVISVSRDISARKAKDRAYDERGDLMRAVFDMSPVGIDLVDAGTLRYIDVNPMSCQMLGYSAEEMRGMPLIDTQPDGRDEAELAEATDGLRDAGQMAFEHRHRRKDGQEIDVQLNLRLIRMGERELIVGIWSDITERKRAEARLRMLAQAVEQSPESIVVADLDARIEFVNDAFVRTTGYRREEVLGQNPRILQSGRTPRASYDTMWATLRAGDVWKGEFINRRKDGSEYIEFVFIAPLRQPDGRITHYVAVKEDITEKKRIGSELDLHRRHLEQLVDARTREIREVNARLTDTQFAMDRAGIGIHWVDADTGRFLYANPQGAEMLGYSPEEMLALTVADVDPSVTPGAFAARTAGIREAGSATFELPHRHRDGRMIPMQLTLYFLPAREGWPPRFVAFLTDITRRKAAAEELLRAKEQAETANIAKSAFLANMSHEIRTPLNAITGMAHLIRRAGVPDDQADRLDKIDAAGQHLLEIINAVLDLSKIEAGKFTLEDAPIALGELAAEVVAMIRERAGAKGLSLRIDVAAPSFPLRGDGTRLRQALLNYATNAIKFTTHGGITLRLMTTSESADEALVRFEVEDTGIGIAAEALPRLFHAFEQADNSTTRQYGGTGLGLAITRRIADLMGGTAGVDSQPGRGSTFWFTARLRKSATTTKSSADVAASAEETLKRAHGGKRILVVDDEPVNREVAVALVSELGLHTEIALDGQEALDRAREQSYDLILMDMQMPRLDGLEATRAIRALPGPRVPIVAMTANAFAEDREKCLAAGMDDFLSKPMHPDALFAMLLKWLAAPSRQG